jgi:hypothetical protein
MIHQSAAPEREIINHAAIILIISPQTASHTKNSLIFEWSLHLLDDRTTLNPSIKTNRSTGMNTLLHWEQQLLTQIRTVLLILAEADLPESWQAQAEDQVEKPE